MDNNKNNIKTYSYKEINPFIETMRPMFDLVRIVDAQECREISITDDGQIRFGAECYAVWNACYRCSNCTSLKSCKTLSVKTRLEFFNDKKYNIRSVPVRIILADDTIYSCNIELINIEALTKEERNTESKDDYENREYLASHDQLTGILNWDGFTKRARTLINEQPDREWLLICSNIRDFKLVNSLFGHDRGDDLLISVAAIYDNLAGKEGAAGRVGGDSFSICIPRLDDIEERLTEGIKKIKALINSPSYSINVHLGIYNSQSTTLPISIMYDRAYMAMQTLRSSREQSIAWFDDSILANALHEQKIISDFEKNLKSGQFVIFLQPQVGHDNKIEGAECLVRWLLPDGKMVPPFEFIGILEQSDLISNLDKYVWELAVKQLDNWKGTPYENLYLSINVSPQDFYYIDVAQVIIDLCSRYDIPPAKLHVEITETAIANETQDNIETLEKLQSNGFTIEIDDFGKGSSSLSLLKDIKADVLKIDMGFLRESENSDRGNIIIRSVIDMAKNLGMGIITEGVETQNQLETLSEMGCHTFQGYFFSRPVPVAAFESLVNKNDEK